MAPRNYNAINGRVQYRLRNFQIWALQMDYNNNSISLTNFFSSHSPLRGGRIVDAAPVVLAGRGLFQDAPGYYGRNCLPSSARHAHHWRAFAFFSNIHTVYSGIRFQVKDLVDFTWA